MLNYYFILFSSFHVDRIMKDHPGAIVHLSDNPFDANKVSCHHTKWKPEIFFVLKRAFYIYHFSY